MFFALEAGVGMASSSLSRAQAASANGGCRLCTSHGRCMSSPSLCGGHGYRSGNTGQGLVPDAGGQAGAGRGLLQVVPGAAMPSGPWCLLVCEKKTKLH